MSKVNHMKGLKAVGVFLSSVLGLILLGSGLQYIDCNYSDTVFNWTISSIVVVACSASIYMTYGSGVDQHPGY